MKLIEGIIRATTQWLMLVILISIPVCAIMVMGFYTVSYPEHFRLSQLPIIIATLIVYLAIYRIVDFSKFSVKQIITVSFIVANTAMIYCIATIHTIPCSDYKVIYETAEQMANGTFDINEIANWTYLRIFPYQMGIISFEYLIFKIFGVGMLPLQIITLVVFNLTMWMLYITVKKIMGKRPACYALILMATYYPMIITVNQFTNQHLALLFILVILYLLYTDKWWCVILAAALTVVMNVLRPMGVILLLTYAVMAVYLYFKNRRLPILAKLLVFILIYKSGIMAADAIYLKFGYSLTPISEKQLPYFKFDKGLTGYDVPEIYKFDYSIEKFNKWEGDKLKTLITHQPQVIATYVATKMIRYQGEYDWKFENTYNHDSDIHNVPGVRIWVMIGWAQYLIAALLAIYGYKRWRNNRDIDVYQIFYVGITLVYIFIEAFSSYRYESYPILLMMAGYGMYELLESRKSA